MIRMHGAGRAPDLEIADAAIAEGPRRPRAASGIRSVTGEAMQKRFAAIAPGPVHWSPEGHAG